MFKFVVRLSSAVSLLAVSLLTSSAAFASDEADMSYDAIVDQLNRETAQAEAQVRAKNPLPTAKDSSSLDTVVMHGGIGFANFIQSVRFDDGTSTILNQKGLQGALGIDLFSPNWMAEGTLRSFAEDGDTNVRSSVHEFELKAIYKNRFSHRLGLRAGGGVTGRYLTIKRANEAAIEYTTPMSVATLGGDLFVTDRVSFGADVNARNALVGETIDHNSFDMTIRVDAHF